MWELILLPLNSIREDLELWCISQDFYASESKDDVEVKW